MLLLWRWSMIFSPKQLQYIYLHLFMSIPPPNSLYYRPRKNNAKFFLNFCCLPKWAPRNLHIPPLGSMISRGPCRYVRGPTASALFALWPRTVVHATGHVEVPWGGHFQIFLLRLGRKSGFMLYIVLMISHVFLQGIGLIGVLKYIFVSCCQIYFIGSKAMSKGTHGILTSKKHASKIYGGSSFFLKPLGTKSATSSFHLKSGIFGPALEYWYTINTGFLAKEKQQKWLIWLFFEASDFQKPSYHIWTNFQSALVKSLFWTCYKLYRKCVPFLIVKSHHFEGTLPNEVPEISHQSSKANP